MAILNDYINALYKQRDNLANNLTTMGVDSATTEKFNTLVPKVLQIPQEKPATETEVTIFNYGSTALETYGETIYTFYNDGYRNIKGFAENYPNFCSEANNYALSYNITDFGWSASIYTMSTTPVKVSASKKILFSYKSGATDTGEMWLVPKSSDSLSAADLARYIYEATQASGGATAVTFKWYLSSDEYINVLCECSNVTSGEYYLCWKGVSDNSAPVIRSIKVLEASI